MSGRDNELDCSSGKGRVASAHQLFGSLAFALTFKHRLAAIRERDAGAARTGLIVFDHRETLSKFIKVSFASARRAGESIKPGVPLRSTTRVLEKSFPN